MDLAKMSLEERIHRLVARGDAAAILEEFRRRDADAKREGERAKLWPELIEKVDRLFYVMDLYRRGGYRAEGCQQAEESLRALLAKAKELG